MKAKLIQVISDVDISQSWDRDSGYGGVYGSTTFWGLFDDGILRYWKDDKWQESGIPTEIEVKEDD